MAENIFPVYDKMLGRDAKEQLLGQRGMMVWFTGLSGSGKSTVALAAERELHAQGRLTMVLDGDNIRHGINSDLGFSEADRHENIRRIAEVGKLFVDCGVIVLACFVSPTVEMRSMARDIIGREDFREVYVNTPLEECERRDVKGLYARARRGEVKDFTGVNAVFEEPTHPDLCLNTAELPLEESVRRVVKLISE